MSTAVAISLGQGPSGHTSRLMIMDQLALARPGIMIPQDRKWVRRQSVENAALARLQFHVLGVRTCSF